MNGGLLAWIRGDSDHGSGPQRSWKRKTCGTFAERLRMDGSFDIFRVEAGGTLLWQGTALTLEDARTRVCELVKKLHADHVVINLRSGARYTIKAAEADCA